MSNFYRLFTFSITLSIALFCGYAGAAPRTFVASFGADTNTASKCSVALPCRGFAAAQTVTDNGGEIIVLDSAGYGIIAITKSISIIAPAGVYAGIAVFVGTNGVTIATPGVNVILRGISINGQGGQDGISMLAGNSLTIENCVLSGLAGSGIVVNTAAIINIHDTIVRRNNVFGVYLLNGAKGTINRVTASGNSNTGILVEGTTATTTTIVDIADTTVDGNFSGVVVRSSDAAAIVKVSVRGSSAVRNASFGLFAQSLAEAAVTLSASNNIVSNNFNGIGAFFVGAKVIASSNVVTGNTNLGLDISSGALLESAGNNTVRNNNVNTRGSITLVSNL